MYYQTEIRPDRIAVLLRENSGLTFAELSEILDADLQKRHPAFMDLINIFIQIELDEKLTHKCLTRGSIFSSEIRLRSK